MEPSRGFRLRGTTPEVGRQFCSRSLCRLLLGAETAGDGIEPPKTVGDGSPDAMLGEGTKRSSLGRVEPARGLDQPQIARPHEVVEVHACGKPFLKTPSDLNDEAEIPFGEFVGRRPGCRYPAGNGLPFTLRHTSLLFGFGNLEWLKEFAGIGGCREVKKEPHSKLHGSELRG